MTTPLRPYPITSLAQAPFNLDETGVLWVEETLASMPEDDKLRQLFCLITYDDNEDSLRTLAQVTRPGGIMCRPMPLTQCRRAVTILQESSPIPLLISGNLEAGGNQAATEGTQMARPLQIAAMPTGRAAWAETLGCVAAREGIAAGLNWAFAPVADIDFNWRNPITNTRTFGSDPAVVADLTEAFVRGMEAEGMAACAKHFPGDGRDERDQHIAPSVNDMTTDDWDATYGRVYRSAIRAGTRSVMVGHILQPAWSRRLDPRLGDRDILPATVSPELVMGLLRDRLGFEGLIVTDSTTMAGLGAFLPRAVSVPLSIAAGCDMFLFAKDYEEDLTFMRRGLEKGILTRERLDQAVLRILALKASLGLHVKRKDGDYLMSDTDARAVVGCKTHKAYARTVAEQSITLVRSQPGVLPLTPERYPRLLFVPLDNEQAGVSVFSADSTQNSRFARALEQAGFSVTVFTAAPGYEGMMSPTRDTTDKYDAIVYSASLATRSNQTTVRITWQNPMGVNVPVYTHSVPTLFISFDNPYHLIDVPQVPTFINCYADTDPVIAALMDKLLGHAPFVGVSPIDPFCGRGDLGY